ncbi:O-antigen ligase family protein [Myroides profundi]|nr:O-antigen ligase family protein [Myroides profundi]
MKKEIIFYLAFIFSASLPLSTKVANVCLILLGLAVIIKVFKDGINLNKKSFIKYGLTTTVFVLVLLTIGLFFTDDVNNAFKYYGRFSSYFIVPLIFSFLPFSFLNEIKKTSCKGLIIGSVISSLILISITFFRYYVFKGNTVQLQADILSYDFTYHQFASQLNFHPVFLGFYIVLAIVFLIEYKGLFNNYLKIFSLFTLLLCLLFLNARSPLLLLCIYFIVFFIRRVLIYFKYKKGLGQLFLFLGFTVMIVVSAIIFLKDTYLYQRFSKHIVWELTENKGTSYDGVYSNDSRVSRWKAIASKGGERPFFGHGAASEDKVVLIAYEENQLMYAYKEEYGPHNQYLSFFVEYGLFGVAIFIFYLFYNLRNAITSRDILYLFMFIIVAVGSLFDSILYRNMVVIFVGFYCNLFTIMDIKRRKNEASNV